MSCVICDPYVTEPGLVCVECGAVLWEVIRERREKKAGQSKPAPKGAWIIRMAAGSPYYFLRVERVRRFADSARERGVWTGLLDAKRYASERSANRALERMSRDRVEGMGDARVEGA